MGHFFQCVEEGCGDGYRLINLMKEQKGDRFKACLRGFSGQNNRHRDKENH